MEFVIFWGTLALIWYISSLFDSRKKRRKYKKSSNRKENYIRYINSREWQSKRTTILKRDGYLCQQCGSNSNLDVHHITYKRFTNENQNDLITVCRYCHNEIHLRCGKNAGYYPLK